FRYVGPQDSNGEPIGGKSLARATIELTAPVIEKVRVAVFYDAGYVNARAYDSGLQNLAQDVGIGLRLNLPIGPLRLDYGIPLQAGQGSKGGGKFNFNVGYQF
ncbi:MAG TPA: BamA/TamA family outer membrane protein, partial [Pyrinomonadaceae bacterium]